MAYREKYKPYILKYKALVLKYVPCIFALSKCLIISMGFREFFTRFVCAEAFRHTLCRLCNFCVTLHVKNNQINQWKAIWFACVLRPVPRVLYT